MTEQNVFTIILKFIFKIFFSKTPSVDDVYIPLDKQSRYQWRLKLDTRIPFDNPITNIRPILKGTYRRRLRPKRGKQGTPKLTGGNLKALWAEVYTFGLDCHQFNGVI
jgi:hypothetical protein